MIPLKYNVRNLRVRWVNTFMTVLGTGLIVWGSCSLFCLVEGLQASLRLSADPLDVIVLRKGSTNETNGGFDTTTAQKILDLRGIERDEKGQPLAAIELLNIALATRADGQKRANLIVRGIDPASRKLRPDFKIVNGRDFDPGKGEAIVSQSLARRFAGGEVGGTMVLGEKEKYRVVGLFTAGGSAAESEVWVDRKDLEQNTRREGTISSVQLRAASPADLQSIKQTLENDTQFRLNAVTEADYFAEQTKTAVFYRVAGIVIAIFLSIGAMFSAANTMFAAVNARTREIGTMRALGFSRLDILVSFLGESLLLCTLGGILGVLGTLPLSTLTFGTNSIDTFAEVAVRFRFGPSVAIVAAAMTLAMGFFGGLFPAVRAVRMDVIRALRQV